MKDSKDISIYVHIPFCVRKCLYCDFNSGKYPDYMIDSYIDAILKEMDENREVFSGKSLKAVYIGGGTPSSVPPSYIGLIFDRISDIIPIEDDTEITIEINPGTTTDHKIKDYVSYGVNRVSVGLQSAVDSELEALGRIHTCNDFLRTYDILKENGIKNINVDIMTSIPHQTKGSLLKTLQEVISLHPQHISAYSLSIEKGTPFYEMGPMRLDLPAENESYEIYKLTQKYLKEHGYSRYEISNYALESKDKGVDYRCRNNLRYWNREDYIGFGASAASLSGCRRYTNISDLDRYIREPGRHRSEDMILDPKDAMAEFMFLGLRKTEGIRFADFLNEFDTDINEVYGEVMRSHVESELAVISGEDEDRRFYLTDRGLDISNEVMCDYLF